VISYCTGKVVASKGLVNVIQLISLHYVLLFKGRAGWHWTFSQEGHGRAADADDPDESIGQSPKSTTMLSSLPRREYSTILLGGNFSRNTLWTHGLGQSNDV